MNSLPLQPDIIAYSATQKPRLLVEVKTRQSVLNGVRADDWPVEIRRQYGHFDCYFLLVTPERMLLFLPGDPAQGGHVVGADPAAVLRSQLDTSRFPLNRLDGQQLTSAVYSWLMFNQFKPADVLLADPAQEWVVRSGLHASIYRGDIQQAA